MQGSAGLPGRSFAAGLAALGLSSAAAGQPAGSWGAAGRAAVPTRGSPAPDVAAAAARVGAARLLCPGLLASAPVQSACSGMSAHQSPLEARKPSGARDGVETTWCAGELVRPGALQTLQILLQETFRIRIFREHCAWVHPLFEAHVRPTLLAHYHSTRRTFASSEW